VCCCRAWDHAQAARLAVGALLGAEPEAVRRAGAGWWLFDTELPPFLSGDLWEALTAAPAGLLLQDSPGPMTRLFLLEAGQPPVELGWGHPPAGMDLLPDLAAELGLDPSSDLGVGDHLDLATTSHLVDWSQRHAPRTLTPNKAAAFFAEIAGEDGEEMVGALLHTLGFKPAAATGASAWVATSSPTPTSAPG
jgi:hypothetical protein